MKKQVEKMLQSTKRPGFTLVETAIALGMVAVMISSFVVVFGPAMKGINKSLSSKDADRLTNALELELGVLRNGETYASTFDKGFQWIQQSGTKATAVLVYQYRGNPASVRTDGTLNPYPYNATNPGIPGKDYVIQTSVRRLNDALVSAELAPGVLEGKVYYAKMQQLIYYDWPGGDTVIELVVAGENEDGLPTPNPAPGGLGQIIDPTEDVNGSRDTVTGSSDYPEAVLSYRVQLYSLPVVLYSWINGSAFNLADDNNDGHPDLLSKPVLTKNMAVMR